MKVVTWRPDLVVITERGWLGLGLVPGLAVPALIVWQVAAGQRRAADLIFAASAAAGLLLLIHLFGLGTTVEFSRLHDRVTRRRSHIIPFWPTSVRSNEVRLSAVEEAWVEERDGTYRVALRVSDGSGPPTTWPLAFSRSGSGQGWKLALADELNAWMADDRAVS